MLEKNYSISFVRLIAMFMVIVGHILPQWDGMSNNIFCDRFTELHCALCNHQCYINGRCKV